MLPQLRRSCFLVLLAAASGCRANLGAAADDGGPGDSKSGTPGASSIDDAATTPISGAEGGAAASSADASTFSSVDSAAPDSDASVDGGLPDALTLTDASTANVAAYGYFYCDGYLYGVPAGGGTPVPLTTTTSPGFEIESNEFFTNLAIPIARDDSRVYFADAPRDDAGPTGNTVNAISVTGAQRVTLASGFDAIYGLAVDSQNLYVLDQAAAYNSSAPSGKVERVPLTGGTPQVLATVSGTLGGIAVDDAYVYWTQTDPASSNGGSPKGEVMRLPLAGGAAKTVATQQAVPYQIAVDGAGILYWLDYGTGGSYCTSTDGTLMKLAPGSAVPVTLASALAGANSLALRDGSVYWATVGSFCKENDTPIGNVFALAGDAGGPVTVAPMVDAPSDLYVDSTTVYFTTLHFDQSSSTTVTEIPDAVPR